MNVLTILDCFDQPKYHTLITWPSKRVDTLICDTTMRRHSINFLYNPGHVILWCLEVVPVTNAREPKYVLRHSMRTEFENKSGHCFTVSNYTILMQLFQPIFEFQATKFVCVWSVIISKEGHNSISKWVFFMTILKLLCYFPWQSQRQQLQQMQFPLFEQVWRSHYYNTETIYTIKSHLLDTSQAPQLLYTNKKYAKM